MKRPAYFINVPILIIVFLFIFSCSDSEHRLPFASKDTATVVIKLGLPDEQAAVSRSLIDRILRIFTRDAMAQTAPAAFSSVSVSVKAFGMLTINQIFTSGTISLTVPAGGSRSFEVIAYTSATDPAASRSFRGTTTLDIPVGQSVDVPVIMNLYETKLVVPDGVSGDVVMIDDMAGTNWKTYKYTGITAGTFQPSDIAYDNRGRIYISNGYTGGETIADIVRIDDINGTNAQAFNSVPNGQSAGYIVRMVIDRQSNTLYFITSTRLYKASLDDLSNATRLDASNLVWNNRTGIDIDGLGMLYLLSSSGNAITKYDPNADQIVYRTTINLGGLNLATDLYIRYPYIYVANYNGASGATPADGYQIVTFQISGESLVPVGHFGNKNNSAVNNSYGMFYGAQNFVALRNDQFIIIDNDKLGVTTDWLCKLVATGITPGMGWQTYGSWSGSQSGPGYFKFYSTC